MKRIEYYVWLVKCLGAGNPRSHKILEVYDDIKEFYDDCKSGIINKEVRLTKSEVEFLCQTDLSDIAFIFKEYQRFNTQYITIEDELYPQQLRNIDNPPLILFVVGDITHLDDELLLTVVGTRKESLYGKRACELICSELCASGFSIVSGLAYGGDTTAHTTALKCGARTYGFLACGLDVDYPLGKADLKNAIYKNGAIITEFLPGTKAYPENFHIRNRLMSGLSEGTLVIEAPKRSGTIITANCAAEQGKDVFAVPAGIFWKNSAGTINLIQNGAKPVKDALDIIVEYLDRYPEKIKIPQERINLWQFFETNRKLGLDNQNSQQVLSDDEYKNIKKQAKKELKSVADETIKQAKKEPKEHNDVSIKDRLSICGLENDSIALKIIELLKDKCYTVDELSDKIDIPASKVMIIVTKLEICGVIKKLPGNMLELIF